MCVVCQRVCNRGSEAYYFGPPFPKDIAFILQVLPSLDIGLPQTEELSSNIIIVRVRI